MTDMSIGLIIGLLCIVILFSFMEEPVDSAGMFNTNTVQTNRIDLFEGDTTAIGTGTTRFASKFDPQKSWQYFAGRNTTLGAIGNLTVIIAGSDTVNALKTSVLEPG